MKAMILVLFLVATYLVMGAAPESGKSLCQVHKRPCNILTAGTV
jgi:hypothetical protein